MHTTDIEWKTMAPPAPLSDFVESFWMIANNTSRHHQVVIIPDGRFDIIFSREHNGGPAAILRGLDTEPSPATISANTSLFGVSFKLLAIEYLLNDKVGSLLNEGLVLPVLYAVTSAMGSTAEHYTHWRCRTLDAALCR